MRFIGHVSGKKKGSSGSIVKRPVKSNRRQNFPYFFTGGMNWSDTSFGLDDCAAPWGCCGRDFVADPGAGVPGLELKAF